MTFAEQAIQLAGHSALLLGWKPDDFWHATPAELVSILKVMSPETGTASSQTVAQLMELYPDAHTGGE